MKNETIVAFHIGRGGRFNNSGYTTFLGEKRIGDFTDNLFTRFQNENEILETLSEDVRDEFKDLCVDENYIVLEDKFGVTKEMLGDIEYYCGASMQEVGLLRKEVEEGVGTIDIDGEYNTTYTTCLEDCDRSELLVLAKSNEWELLKEYGFKDAEKFHGDNRLVEMVQNDLVEWDKKYVICDKSENSDKPYIAEDLSNTGDSESAWQFDSEGEAQEVIDNAQWDWAYIEEV